MSIQKDQEKDVQKSWDTYVHKSWVEGTSNEGEIVEREDQMSLEPKHIGGSLYFGQYS